MIMESNFLGRLRPEIIERQNGEATQPVRVIA